MFKSLRNSFIRMNMIVISLIVFISFLIVYILVYSNTQREVQDELHILLNLADNPAWQDNAAQWYPQEKNVPDMPNRPGGPFANIPRIGLAVRVQNNEIEITQSRLFYAPTEAELRDMLTSVVNESGNFKLHEHVWAYRAIQEDNGAQKVAFVEISESRAVLSHLIRMFLMVIAILLVAIWLVSRWFANRSVAPIEEAYNNQRRFIQDASHDLKTPVAVIKTNLELLQAYPEDASEAKDEWLANIHTETLRMERMTAQLLSLARAESEQPAQRQTFSLSEVVSSCVLPMEAVIFEKKLHFHEEVEDDIIITGYPDDIDRLVHILMENAIKYTPQGGSIKLCLHAEKRKAILQVSNTGEGIPEEDLPHVFERFYRGDSARNREQDSYGLGLAIAQSIVQRHKGTLTAQSTTGAKTTFTVKLPL